MKTWRTVVLKTSFFILLLLDMSCRDNSVSVGNGTNTFLVKITVKDSRGQPVQGLAVSLYNDLGQLVLKKERSSASPSEYDANTTISFSTASSSLVTLSMYDLDGRLVDSALADKPLLAGRYNVVESLNATGIGTRVYKSVLTAVNDTSGQILFKDSIYITLWNNNPSQSIAGYTSASGTYETTDSLSFPNVLTLPPMVATNETGPAPIGVFSFPDSVVITLTDTTSSKSVSYVRQVPKGQNEFSLSWSPSANDFAISHYSPPMQGRLVVVPRNSSAAPIRWALSQNFPNPFGSLH